FQAFNIEVCTSGRIHNVEKRYSEFEDLHKQGILQREMVPKLILRFLNINFVRTGSEESFDQFSSLPDMVAEGVLQGLYNNIDDLSLR
ncbi:hypothetical protein KUTeg_017983, partial [Tegillarca granosa]